MSEPLHRVEFSVAIGPEDWLDYYRHPAASVLVTADDGRRIRFPARLLHRHATREGVRGRFRLLYDGQGRQRGLERLA
ncbi:DUF2835 family protein [Spiribacter halobius]|uniref:DUF2835 family protein n=1 Tax=Sediminicurvatus halobius TaxID=2182432 RepID=UPI001E588279|nr:DUF2835 family protein [Spiribacter halobius]UEX77525.1 DUF2835 domain-containing protein [Spiribacter halobius]